MFKKLGLFSVMTLMLVLAACSAAPAAQAANGTSGNQTAASTPQPGQRQVGTETKLLIGTLKLEGTDQAVTKDQAVQLLPLWKAVKSLTASQTSSQEEIDALYTQIQGTMTADQNKAIDGMQITFQSMGEEMQKLGITPVAGGFGGGTPSPAQLATRQAREAQGGGNFVFGGGRDGGPGGAGGPTGGGGFFPGSGQTGQNNGQFATAVAGRRTGGGRTNPALVDALIKLLEERSS